MKSNKIVSLCISLAFCLLFCHFAYTQSIDTTHNNTIVHYRQKDFMDVMRSRFKHFRFLEKDIEEEEVGKVYASVLPAIGYTLETGFAATIVGNLAFYTDGKKDSKISHISSSVAYTQYNQFIFPIRTNIWTKENKYNLVGDWRYMKYPQNTYGLGSGNSLSDADLIDYSYYRFYQTALRKITNHFFAGIGYNLDYHWNIIEKGTAQIDGTDFQNYHSGSGGSKSISSGMSVNVLYDNRQNSINPDKGLYGNIIYRSNLTFLGSDQNWQSLQLDFRKYIKLNPNSNNILAIWNYNWLTLSGNPPYLDLPSTGWDMYANTGRGYIQGRFRSKNLIYLETEYRFGITKNGLFGGVVFGNIQSVTENITNRFQSIMPAAGCGLRLKLNKHSRTNLALDYAVGIGGSNGMFFNVGEVF